MQSLVARLAQLADDFCVFSDYGADQRVAGLARFRVLRLVFRPK